MILQNTAKPFTCQLGKCFLLCPDFRKAFVGCSCTSGFFRCKAALYDRFLSLPDAFHIDPDRYICHAAADKRACMGKTKMQLSFLRKKGFPLPSSASTGHSLTSLSASCTEGNGNQIRESASAGSLIIVCSFHMHMPVQAECLL